MEENLQIKVESLQELSSVAQLILNFAGKSRVFLFQGEMGAGKTTLIKELCLALGSKDHFSSPTYSIVNEYNSANGKIFHFDLYRLKSSEELLDIGIEDYLSKNAFCFFEWPELAKEFIVDPHVQVQITVEEDNRIIVCEKIK